MEAAPVADGWEAALAAALLGAERAPPAPPDGVLPEAADGRDPGAALLDRLAAQGAHHRAGAVRPPYALTPLPPRPLSRPDCPPAAAARLALLLAGGAPARARLGEWCELAAQAGLRPPVWLLPALAAHRNDWNGAVERIAGPEMAWLTAVCEPGAEPSPEPSDWTEGSVASRRSAFEAFRERDPEAARAALEAAFRNEKAPLREALVAALFTGLSEADAPFLEACLDDRALGVRAAAQRLLPRLPRSLLASRMAVRASAALAVETKRGLLGGRKHSLVVTLPEESPTLARDGIEPRSYERRSGGARAGLLRDIVAAAPLAAFAAHPPGLWIELALRSEWAAPLFEGFLAAIRRAGDPDWARGMAGTLAQAYAGRLSGLRRTNELRDLWARAAALLPPPDWERTVEEAFHKAEADVVLAHLSHSPGAFSERFTRAHLDWIARVVRGPRADRDALARTWMLDRLGERASPGEDAHAAAAAILGRLPADAEERLRGQIATLAETLALRTALRREFARETTQG